jgi:hypothetical protein
LRAEALAQDGFGAASASTTFSVRQGETRITAAIPDGAVVPYSASGWDVGARASSGQAVTISVVDPQACVLQGNRIFAGEANSVDCVLNLSSFPTNEWTAGTARLTFDITEVYASWTVSGPTSIAPGEQFTITATFTHPASPSDAGIAVWLEAFTSDDRCSLVGENDANRAITATFRAVGASGDTCRVGVQGGTHQWFREGPNTTMFIDISIV